MTSTGSFRHRSLPCAGRTKGVEWLSGLIVLSLAMLLSIAGGCDDDPSACESGQTLCGESCCDGECVDGECLVTCDSPLELCGGECVNLQLDPAHCGSCDQSCNADEVCWNGTCSSSCPTELADCNGFCVDLQSDFHHCGNCDEECNEGEVCIYGECGSTCPEGLQICDGSCVDVESDVEHCGNCVTVCGELEECVDGGCVELPRADGFTSQEPGDSDVDAALFGVREIVLETGDGSVSNPFRTDFAVTFTPPTGEANSVTVNGFYDGDNTWRARVYVTEAGLWTWSTNSDDDSGLDGVSGTFNAIRSGLRGKLRKHPDNNQRWATEDGQFFLALGDTPYLLLNDEYEESVFQHYVVDATDRGISLMRAGYGGGYSVWSPGARASDGRYPRANWIHDDGDYDRFDLPQLQTSDQRLAWILTEHPGLIIDLHLLPKDENSGARWYGELNETQREQTLEHLTARLAAFPNVIFLIERDVPHTYNTWEQNLEMMREVGRYLAEHDPWDTLRTGSEKSRELNQLTTQSDFDDWQTYLEVQSWGYPHGDAVDHYYRNIDYLPVHVFHGEDRYEYAWRGQPSNPEYYYRRMFWSNLFSGGGGTYGSKYKDLIPYTLTGETTYYYSDTESDSSQLHGLDETIHIVEFFDQYDIDMADFVPDDALARMVDPAEPEGDDGPSRVQCAHDGVNRYLLYHPNADDGELSSEDITDAGEDDPQFVASRYAASLRADRTPAVEVDLSASSGMEFAVSWYHPTTGESHDAGVVDGGDWTTITAPSEFSGFDAVLYLEAVEPRSFIIAHRGGGAHEDGWGPENTLAVFRKCFANGVSIETDLNYTSDGEIILFHGGDLAVTTDGEGAPTERTFDEIRALDAAAHNGWSEEYSPQLVPTFEELLDEFALLAEAGTMIVADAHRVDTPETMQRVLELLDDTDLFDRVALQVYDFDQAEALREEARELFGTPDTLELAIWVNADRGLLQNAVDAGYFSEIHASSSLADEASDLPLSIRFIGGGDDWRVEGVDGIGTDWVDAALEAIEENVPTVSFAAPTDDARVPTGAVHLRVDHGDSDGSIDRVEFYEGLNLLGRDESPPFELAWQDARPGTYSLTARVYDRGRHRTSEAIRVTVE